MKIEGTQIHFLSDVSAEVGLLGSCKIIGISKAIPHPYIPERASVHK